MLPAPLASSGSWRADRRKGRALPPRSSCGATCRATTPTCAGWAARGVPDPRCRGRGWVRPITFATAFRRLFQVAFELTSDRVIEEIARAKPTRRGRRTAGSATSSLAGAGIGSTSAGGSNAIAVGRDGAREHRHGLLLGNPHLPWQGTDRFYQAQLTIPGQLDVQGASLYGFPPIQIGHTRQVAWSHTTPPGLSFTIYRLTLARGAPTSYLLDGRRVR